MQSVKIIPRINPSALLAKFKEGNTAYPYNLLVPIQESSITPNYANQIFLPLQPAIPYLVCI